MPTDFSADASALGYLYQVRYALLLLLTAETDRQISIELIDDITFHKDGSPTELIQGKHSVNATGSLTDASTDLWKTLRVWMSLVEQKRIRLDDVILSLVTTNAAPDGSAASKLRPDASMGRDVSDAERILTTVTQTSRRNADSPVGQAMKSFSDLSQDERLGLLSRVYVLDSSPNIVDVRPLILRELRTSTREQFVEKFFERLEGWWFNRVINHLAQRPANLISYRELWLQINDIQEQFHADNLPIDFLDAITPQEDDLSPQERIFIEQLRLVIVSEPRVQRAINDYYKAFQHRSKWIREDLVNISELEKYEKSLCDEWENVFLIMQERLSDGTSDEERMKLEGRELYNLVSQKFNVHIRPRCTEPYVMRGSYHMLANRLKIGWHADFLNRLQHLLGNQGGNA